MRCGTCCFSESERHARVTGDDHARMGDDADELVVFLGNQAFMRLSPPVEGEAIRRCAALVLDAESGTFACRIYERRPEICRTLERGSPACMGELATKRTRPVRALAILRERPCAEVDAPPEALTPSEALTTPEPLTPPGPVTPPT